MDGSLRDFTAARVSLGSAGSSLPTRPSLELRLAHARARDAVHFALDFASLEADLCAAGWPACRLRSAARDRAQYLRRPDQGRILNEESREILAGFAKTEMVEPKSVIVVADGLSALAIHRHAVPLLQAAMSGAGWTPREDNPIFVVEQARVAIGDEIGEILKADLVTMLIGERPGLTTPDSLGIYLTWRPRRGRTDAERNCISNVHSAGLPYDVAAHRLAFLIRTASALQLSGVALKETADEQKAELSKPYPEYSENHPPR